MRNILILKVLRQEKEQPDISQYLADHSIFRVTHVMHHTFCQKSNLLYVWYLIRVLGTQYQFLQWLGFIFCPQNFGVQSLRVGWRNFFSSCAFVSVFSSGRKYVLIYILTYLEYNTVWRCVTFLVLARKSFWCYIRTQCTIQLCGCVSFLVVMGNSSQNENPF